MCGISGVQNLLNKPQEGLSKYIHAMNFLQEHRGPDGEGVWINENNSVGFGHRRLSIIDLEDRAAQPMRRDNISITYNGEIYNYKELKKKYSSKFSFTTNSDTEVIIAGYKIYGKDFIHDLRGMFSFAIWDEKEGSLFCARDRFGIKPFHYTHIDNNFYFASEAKALIPFLKEINTNQEAFSEYLIFQYSISNNTLFDQIFQLQPGHFLEIKNGKINIQPYWDIEYKIDWNTSASDFNEQITSAINDSINYHLVSDVEVGAYVSGGVDSSLVLNLASNHLNQSIKCFNGRFSQPSGFDESEYAQRAADHSGSDLIIKDISSNDFEKHIKQVIYSLDYPVAGPGSFPQFMTSMEASKHLKVLLGGQGGDEIFGGYARYIIAYLEQCLKASIEGTASNGNYLVTLESIIPNLQILNEYKPLLSKFWSKGLFDEMDMRYLFLLNKSTEFGNEINWEFTNLESVEHRYKKIFNNQNNVRKEAYFDKMTHFDFKTLLPALLQVEDRVSMAHGLESRVPFIDTAIVELLASVPADKKFPNGEMKYLLKHNFKNNIPHEILARKDKMGFPVPLHNWFSKDLKGFMQDIFSDINSKKRDIFNTVHLKDFESSESKYSRKTWAIMSLELWHQSYHDNFAYFKALIKD